MEAYAEKEARVLAELNRELQQVKTFEQFEALSKKMSESGFAPSFRYKSNKGSRTGTNRTAYSFTPLPWNANIIHFLLDDSVSTRRMKVENLRKRLEVVA